MFNKLKCVLKKAAAVSLSAALALGVPGVRTSRAYADTEENAAVTAPRSIVTLSESSYSQYIGQYPDAQRTVVSLYADTASYSTSPGAKGSLLSSYEGMPNVLLWENGGTVTFPFEVYSAGLYDLELIYRTAASDTTELSVGVMIDGELPFSEAAKIPLDKYWRNKTGNIQYDSTHRNQIRPTQVISDSWITYTLLNKSDFSGEPFSFYLTPGEHTVTLQNAPTDLYIARINFTNTSTLKSYAEVKPTAEEIEATPALVNGEAILVEAEVPSYTNSAALQPTREPTEYLASPAHPTDIRYNTIGGTVDSPDNAWDEPSQKAVYEVNVPANGYYSISLRCRRNSSEGLSSYRRITVNGAVPCKELDAVRIDYSTKWQTLNLTDENGEPIYFYLQAGDNTIAIEAVTGGNEQYAAQAEDTLQRLYDALCDAEDKSPDELIEVFTEVTEELDAQNAEIRDEFGVEIAEMSKLSLLLKSMLKKSEFIKDASITRQSEIESYITELVSRVRNFRCQPLELDYFEIKTAHEEYRDTRVNVFKAIVFAFSSFIGSFFKDFDALRQPDYRTMDVWVCLDRKDAEIISDLVEKQYNADHDLKINIRPDNGKLCEAVVSGKGPQAALFVDSDTICEMLERGALANLKDCQNFGEVYSRFPSGLSETYAYDNGVYGVPLTNSFPMMFYRADIFAELGITPPTTWEEFSDVMEIIYGNGMRAGLVSSEDNPNGFCAGDIFIAMLNQTEEKQLQSDSAAAAFEAWAEICGEYGLCDEDVFAMFRTGEMPLVVADYTEFSSRLDGEAYELTGRWGLAHIPGTYRMIGGLRTLDCSVNTNSLGAVVFKDCGNVSAAWEFISWFTSSEVQQQLAAAFGGRRYSSANMDFSCSQYWGDSEYREIALQRESTLQLQDISLSEDVKNAVYSALDRALQGENARDVYLDELRRHLIISD